MPPNSDPPRCPGSPLLSSPNRNDSGQTRNSFENWGIRDFAIDNRVPTIQELRDLWALSFEASLLEHNTGSWCNNILLDGAHLTVTNFWRWEK